MVSLKGKYISDASSRGNSSSISERRHIKSSHRRHEDPKGLMSNDISTGNSFRTEPKRDKHDKDIKGERKGSIDSDGISEHTYSDFSSIDSKYEDRKYRMNEIKKSKKGKHHHHRGQSGVLTDGESDDMINKENDHMKYHRADDSNGTRILTYSYRDCKVDDNNNKCYTESKHILEKRDHNEDSHRNSNRKRMSRRNKSQGSGIIGNTCPLGDSIGVSSELSPKTEKCNVFPSDANGSNGVINGLHTLCDENSIHTVIHSDERPEKQRQRYAAHSKVSDHFVPSSCIVVDFPLYESPAYHFCPLQWYFSGLHRQREKNSHLFFKRIVCAIFGTEYITFKMDSSLNSGRNSNGEINRTVRESCNSRFSYTNFPAKPKLGTSFNNNYTHSFASFFPRTFMLASRRKNSASHVISDNEDLLRDRSGVIVTVKANFSKNRYVFFDNGLSPKAYKKAMIKWASSWKDYDSSSFTAPPRLRREIGAVAFDNIESSLDVQWESQRNTCVNFKNKNALTSMGKIMTQTVLIPAVNPDTMLPVRTWRDQKVTDSVANKIIKLFPGLLDKAYADKAQGGRIFSFISHDVMMSCRNNDFAGEGNTSSDSFDDDDDAEQERERVYKGRKVFSLLLNEYEASRQAREAIERKIVKMKAKSLDRKIKANKKNEIDTDETECPFSGTLPLIYPQGMLVFKNRIPVYNAASKVFQLRFFGPPLTNASPSIKNFQLYQVCAGDGRDCRAYQKDYYDIKENKVIYGNSQLENVKMKNSKQRREKVNEKNKSRHITEIKLSADCFSDYSDTDDPDLDSFSVSSRQKNDFCTESRKLDPITLWRNAANGCSAFLDPKEAVIQLQRASETDFALDFKAPFSAIHALAVAVATLDRF